jgi:multiple sugar transport system substrate-binding protein
VQAASVLHSDAFCIAASAADKDAAWRFIEFAVGDAGQTLLAETGRIVPSRISVSTSDAFLQPMGEVGPLLPASNQVYLDNLEVMERLPNISTWLEVEDAFNARFERIFYDEIDIPATMAEVIAETKPIFARAAEERAGS